MATDIFIDSYRYNPDYHRFADMMGVDRDSRNDIKVAKKMALLYDWASIDTGRKDLEGIVERIEGLRKEQGVSFMGHELVNYLYQKVRIHMDKVKEAAQELEKRVKVEEARQELANDRKEGKEWMKDHEEMKVTLAKSHRVNKKELTQYYNLAKKDIPTFDKQPKPVKVKETVATVEYV